MLLRHFMNDEWAARGSQSLDSIFDQVGRPSGWRKSYFDRLTTPIEKGALSAILERMAKDGLLTARKSEQDHQMYYEAAHDILNHPRYDYIYPRVANQGLKVEVESVSNVNQDNFTVQSTRWTGTQFVLVDGGVLEQVRCKAQELHQVIHAMHFPSNSESQDVKGLADALIAICSMAEPEVTLLDRLLASPKFKAYASLLGIVALIRGAIGI